MATGSPPPKPSTLNSEGECVKPFSVFLCIRTIILIGANINPCLYGMYLLGWMHLDFVNGLPTAALVRVINNFGLQKLFIGLNFLVSGAFFTLLKISLECRIFSYLCVCNYFVVEVSQPPCFQRCCNFFFCMYAMVRGNGGCHLRWNYIHYDFMWKIELKLYTFI